MVAHIDGIELKKKFGQHFLRDGSFPHAMIEAVHLTENTSVMEIGCGDGFLTRAILKRNIRGLWVYEIDPDWVDYVRQTVPDERLTVFQENILDANLTDLEQYKPWVVLANLPYQITFPLLYKFMNHRQLFTEGVVMVQEEVAQKIVQKGGRGFGFPSVYLQYHAQWKLLNKVPPTAFYPPPKVDSRLLYFKPHETLKPITEPEKFWRFIKQCFLQPRRTLKNNLSTFHYDLSLISSETLALRAQQMNFDDLLNVWQTVHGQK